ncbi:hypothetical protein M3B90_01325 [Dermabacter sp. p3-SID358]|uniref:DUF7455 domain-containing protein n=1 Tax=Dermabacter sp. p3-SID358 TaxID=2916114 RepID=UPI0021A8AE45|nr:hypothetical protein [Dermabacter sp. p3-SID358]MCT1866175.1 hypothetical protein [Dermabacter sp. p3-SID358]
METMLEERTLTAHDRCDRCGAQAYVKFELEVGGELLFCAHHARANAKALEGIATRVVDETERLTAEQ